MLCFSQTSSHILIISRVSSHRLIKPECSTPLITVYKSYLKVCCTVWKWHPSVLLRPRCYTGLGDGQPLCQGQGNDVQLLCWQLHGPGVWGGTGEDISHSSTETNTNDNTYTNTYTNTNTYTYTYTYTNTNNTSLLPLSPPPPPPPPPICLIFLPYFHQHLLCSIFYDFLVACHYV